MNLTRWLCGAELVLVAFGAACGGLGKPSDAGVIVATDATPVAAGGYFDPALAVAEAIPAPAREGLQYSGAVALRSTRLAATVTRPAGSDDALPETWVELSAAIVPKVGVLYTGQGADYPKTPQAQAQLAHDSALTFATLLSTCQPLYPDIVLWQAGDPPLAEAQVATNYQLLEGCAYAEYLAKPYWIPQLIHDVEICRQELGPGWRMLTEADILALAQGDAQRVQEVFDGVQMAGSTVGSFYFSLSVWVLGNDGTVGLANLQPGSDPSFTPLSSLFKLENYDPRDHYEGGLTLRCLRVTSPGG